MITRFARAAGAVGALALGASVYAGGLLQGSVWQPERMADIAVPDESSAYIQFRSKRRLLGFSGCNRLFAEYHASDGVIFIGPVNGTRRVCAASVMAREAALLDALARARTYRRDGASLVIFDSHNEPLLEMRQTDWN